MSILDDLLVDRVYDVTIAGQTLRVRPITLEQAARLAAWVAKKYPSPLESIAPHAMALKDTVDREKFLDTVASLYESWPPEYGSSEATSRLIYAMPGKAETIREAIRVEHPDIAASDQACWALARKATSDEFVALASAFHDRDPYPKTPKDQPPGGGGLSRELIGASLLAALLGQDSGETRSNV